MEARTLSTTSRATIRTTTELPLCRLISLQMEKDITPNELYLSDASTTLLLCKYYVTVLDSGFQLQDHYKDFKLFPTVKNSDTCVCCRNIRRCNFGFVISSFLNPVLRSLPNFLRLLWFSVPHIVLLDIVHLLACRFTTSLLSLHISKI